MIYTVTLNPALDKTAYIPNFTVNTVNRMSKLRIDPGGKGINVSKVISKLGGKSIAIALLGGATGSYILSALKGQGIECKPFEIGSETRTNLKVVDPKLNTHTDINEPGPCVKEQDLNSVLKALTSHLKGNDIVVLSGSLPRDAPVNTYATWTRACKEAGAKVFLDADGDKLAKGIEASPYLIKPNEIELGALLGRTLDTDSKVMEAAHELVARGIKNVVVSMGANGAIFATKEQAFKAQALKVPVGSTVGAGDSVVAALAYAESNDLPVEDTIRLAMATGAANVMQSGTQAAERSAINKLIGHVNFSAIE
ncbi:MAG: 1-phosphofructokinase [Olegusella sp.]|nr:1-phosphofructokinase [Olegusella sp.]